MRPVSKIDSLGIDESQKGFVDQGGGAERVIRALAAQAEPCQPPELFVDERYQPVQGFAVTRSPILKQTRDFRSGIHLAPICSPQAKSLVG